MPVHRAGMDCSTKRLLTTKAISPPTRRAGLKPHRIGSYCVPLLQIYLIATPPTSCSRDIHSYYYISKPEQACKRVSEWAFQQKCTARPLPVQRIEPWVHLTSWICQRHFCRAASVSKVAAFQLTSTHQAPPVATPQARRSAHVSQKKPRRKRVTTRQETCWRLMLR